MSVKAVTWALEQEIDDPISHLLLVNLADYADKEHKCWPGQDLLAARLRRSTDTVQRHLRKLEKSGHIVSEFRSDPSGHRTSNLYRLNVDVTVGVVPPSANVSRKPKPHPCGIGEKSLNRKSAPPKPQTPRVLNRTLRAVGTLNHQIEPPRSREGVSKSDDLKVKGRPMLAISSEAREEARKLAHGWDIRELEDEWREWNEAQDNVVKDADRAFLAFCRKRGTHKAARKFKPTTPVSAELKSRVLVAEPGERIIDRLGSEWDPWLEFLRVNAPELEKAARKSFAMAVTAPRPYPGCPLPRIQPVPTAAARSAA